MCNKFLLQNLKCPFWHFPLKTKPHTWLYKICQRTCAHFSLKITTVTSAAISPELIWNTLYWYYNLTLCTFIAIEENISNLDKLKHYLFSSSRQIKRRIHSWLYWVSSVSAALFHLMFKTNLSWNSIVCAGYSLFSFLQWVQLVRVALPVAPVVH